MNYEEMSDHEIDTQVTMIVFGCQNWQLSESNISFYHCGIDGGEFHEQDIVNFCNNHSESAQLTELNKISVKYRAGNSSLKPMASSSERDDYYYADENPKRAAMIVFLMMKENQNEQ